MAPSSLHSRKKVTSSTVTFQPSTEKRVSPNATLPITALTRRCRATTVSNAWCFARSSGWRSGVRAMQLAVKNNSTAIVERLIVGVLLISHRALGLLAKYAAALAIRAVLHAAPQFHG